MKRIKKIFSLNTFILLFAFLFLYLSASQLREAFYDRDKLQMHRGALLKKEITIDKDDDQEIKNLVLTLNDQEKYTVSRSVEYIFNQLSTGDTLTLNTIPANGLFSNFTSSDTGDRIRTTNNTNEVYELISKDKITLIDFKQHQEHLKAMLWGFPLASAGLFGWFFYRRHIGIRNETTKKI